MVVKLEWIEAVPKPARRIRKGQAPTNDSLEPQLLDSSLPPYFELVAVAVNPWKSLLDSTMADPLSIAASIAGLLMAAAKITTVLTDLNSKSKAAPKDIEHVRSSVETIRGVLLQLQLLLLAERKSIGSVLL